MEIGGRFYQTEQRITEPVTLVGFGNAKLEENNNKNNTFHRSSSCPSSTASSPTASTNKEPVQGLTYTLKGQRLSRHQQQCSPAASDPILGKPDKVKLVRFGKRGSVSFNLGSGSCGSHSHNNNNNSNGTSTYRAKRNLTSKDLKMERERERLRQERLHRLTQETREWFDKMRHSGATNDATNGSTAPPFTPSDTTRKASFFRCDSDDARRFFDEARQKFDTCSNDLFAQFVRENQERFAQMMGPTTSKISSPLFPTSTTTSNFHTTNGNGAGHANKYSSFEETSSTSQSSSEFSRSFSSSSGFSSRPGSAFAKHSTAERPTSLGSATNNHQNKHHQQHHQNGDFPAWKSSFGSRSSPFANSDSSSSTSASSSGSFPRLSSFGGFPRFTPIILSPPEQFKGTSTVSSTKSSGYQMQSSRSTFEYCGNTNTYRFSTEQVSQCFQDGYDVSESESDDEDEEPKYSVVERPASSSTVSRVDRKGVVSVCSSIGSVAPSELDSTASSVTGSHSDDDDVSVRNSSVLSVGDGVVAKISPVAPCAEAEPSPGPSPRRDKAAKIAHELLATERSYVHILHLIDQVFQFRVDNENRAHHMFPQEMIPQMFSNIKSIYKFHNDFLLPQLEARMKNWEQERRIGDIMKNFAPFLKMYTEYVKNFDNAMNLINVMYAKNQKFAAIMDEIHNSPECGHLTLQHHMLSPIQRVPRYELLLLEYLKKLPDDSPDKEDTAEALHLVSTAANHANEAMKKIDKFKKLLEIQERIGGAVDLVSPTRELLKEGKIVKISARSGDHQERYLFLFSDLFLLCSPTNKLKSGHNHYRLRARFFVNSMQILEGDNLETANTFYVRDTHKNVELYTQTPEEKDKWIEVLIQAVHDLDKRKSSLKIGSDATKPLDNDIGKRPPSFIKMDSVERCMDCSAQFNMMRRKYHCRACGIVVCNKCSPQKYTLPCESNKLCRVCRQCHQILTQQSPEKSGDSPEMDGSNKENNDFVFRKERGLLEVPASAPAVLNGYLQLKTRGKQWVKRWFSLHHDFVLYSYRAHTDGRAMTATPVPGYTVHKVSELKGENTISDKERERVFKLFHTRKSYYFQTASKEELEGWVYALQMAAKAELPYSSNQGTQNGTNHA